MRPWTRKECDSKFEVAICDLKCKYLKNILQGHILWPWTWFVIENEVLMNEIIIKDKKIENMIFEVRGVQVMLSSDVAILYQIETRILNQVIKRNIDRFPSTFCFQLTDE